jgi:conjugal transfer pilus assembly protein TraE
MKKDKEPMFDRTRIKTYMQESSNIFAENKLMRFVTVLILVITLVNSMMLSKSMSSSRTILVDPVTGDEMWLSSNDAEDKYLIRMSRYLIFLTTQLNAGNVDNRLNEALRLIHPSTFSKYQEKFTALKKEVKRYPTIAHFTEIGNNPKSIKKFENSITLDVNRKRVVGSSVTKNEDKKYKIEYKIEGARFWVLEILDVTNLTVQGKQS